MQCEEGFFELLNILILDKLVFTNKMVSKSQISFMLNKSIVLNSEITNISNNCISTS